MKSLLLACCLLLQCSAPPAVSQPTSPSTAQPAATVSQPPWASPVASSAPKPLPVAVAAASASASSAPRPPPRSKLPLPPTPAGADKEKFSLAASVCAVAVKRDKGNLLVGCRSCPPFEGDEGQPDGKIASNPDTFFPLEAVVRGSFTRKGAQQAALVFEGCEPHAANYGGTLLVEKAPDGWNALHYASAFHPRDCKPYRREDGRDLLVCRYFDAHQTTASVTIWSFDFAAASADDAEKGWEVILGTSDNSSSVCLGVPPWGVSAMTVSGYAIRDVNGDGKQDLVIDVRRASVPYSKAFEDKMRKECERQMHANPDGMPYVKPSTFLPPAVTTSLEYVYNGTKFVPTAAAQKKLGAMPKDE
jgi:hypothetical protein